ncbi:hypothetical protein [Burkholderia sp. BE12]|uniref:hypothetical protein n=1 Tax=Burkholderia sp. BE12 TaxID=2082394 RepID=UPI000CF4CA6E|nr:hypothetical protein [Burkholderia sp. BE12]
MLTKNERRALIRARDLIEIGKQDMICLALNAVAVDDPALDRAAERMRFYIHTALDGFATLGGWQLARGIGRSKFDAMRADRLAWIDWMLGEGDGPAA